MKTKIYLTSLLLLFTVTASTWAQTSPIFDYITEINSHMASIPYVFEGQVLSVEIYAGDEEGNRVPSINIQWNDDAGLWFLDDGRQAFGYSLATIRVCKVYKGEDIPDDGDHTFKVLTRSYAINTVYRYYDSDAATYETKYAYVPAEHPRYGPLEEKVFLPADEYPRQIFFCDKIDAIVGADYSGQHYYSNFHSVYELAFNTPVNITQPDGSAIFMNAYSSLYNYVFTGPDELEQFLGYIDDVNPTPENFCEDLGERNGKVQEPVVEEPKIDYEQNLKNYAVRMELINKKLADQGSVGKKTSSTDDLNLDMANERLVRISGQNWYEFDIMVSSNNSALFFDNCLMRIQYNTSVFGSNVVGGSNVVITRASGYNTSTYINPQTNAIDQTSNTMGIPFGTDFAVASWNRVQHTLVPHKMLTIRIKIQSCASNVNLQFVDLATTSILSFFANTANANIVNTFPFDITNYTGNITDNACQPIITSFNNNVPAGIGRHLVINGKYFGTTMGNGTVIFKDANIGVAYPDFTQGAHSSGVQPYDIVSWADNKIVINLPSLIDSAYTYVNVNNAWVPFGPTRVVPGSGKFLVQNFTGTRKESSSPLTITFAHNNVIAPNANAPTGLYRKKQIKLSSPNSYGFTMEFDPAVTTWNASAKPLMRRSMKDWACATGINWTIGADGTTGLLGDNICHVKIGPNNMAALMSTYPAFLPCVSNNIETWYLKSFDMEINGSNLPAGTSWQFDTTGASRPSMTFDFYEVGSHEFGHAHILKHLNDSLNDVMFWSNVAYNFSGALRRHVWTSPGGLDGGNHVADSLTGGLVCVGNHVLVIPNNCTGLTYGIKEYGANLVNLSVYPNPSSVSEDLNIKFDMEKEQMVSFALYGITGNLVKETPPEKLHQSVEYKFHTADISPGIYMLRINVGNKRQTVKVIKQ